MADNKFNSADILILCLTLKYLNWHMHANTNCLIMSEHRFRETGHLQLNSWNSPVILSLTADQTLSDVRFQVMDSVGLLFPRCWFKKWPVSNGFPHSAYHFLRCIFEGSLSIIAATQSLNTNLCAAEGVYRPVSQEIEHNLTLYLTSMQWVGVTQTSRIYAHICPQV